MPKILIIDDEIAMLDSETTILEKQNFSVNSITEWENISVYIHAIIPDLILLDVALAGEDGREICGRLKKSNETKHIPVVLFSAHYDLLNNLQECRADALVTKPFEVSYLLETIRKNININNN